MKKTFFPLLILLTFKGFSQLKEGQYFCSPYEEGSYFPFSDDKKIIWRNTFYFETINGIKEIKGKKYTEVKQEWEDKTVELIYLREDNGIVYQYEECCENETIRYNNNFKIGDKWMKVDKTSEYEILTFDGELKTPYCEYKNLLIIEGKMWNTIFEFYYLKGQGYIGATVNKKLISFVTPEK
jgi:hypothetical protein